MLNACAVRQVPPTVTLEKERLLAKNWHVAVLDFNYEYEGEGQIGTIYYLSAGKDGGRVIANLFAAELAKMDNIKLVERERISKLLEEHTLQQTGIVDVKSAIKILGEVTDYVFWTNSTKYGSTISFSAQMIEVQSGKVMLGAAISRVRPSVEPFPNVQLCAQELLQIIKAQTH